MHKSVETLRYIERVLDLPPEGHDFRPFTSTLGDIQLRVL